MTMTTTANPTLPDVSRFAGLALDLLQIAIDPSTGDKDRENVLGTATVYALLAIAEQLAVSNVFSAKG
jgi:hypothetical protein